MDFEDHVCCHEYDLSGVSGELLLGVYSIISRKNFDFWSSSVEKESPSKIWGGGGRKLLPIFDPKTMATKEVSHFSILFLSFLFVK